ncbi:MAG: hypothetical protein P1V51_11205 [Deltaproteobacteria bacterium]|nr:hypothetical protein [Deltaproteobacteria bacterium]
MRSFVLGGILAVLLPATAAFARDREPVAHHGQSAAELRLESKPSHLVLRRNETATFRLLLPAADGKAEGRPVKTTGPVRVAVNSGTASEPVLEEDGHWRIDYALPEVGYPHYLLMLASVPLSTGEALAAFEVPLSGIARVKVDTIPGARVYGEIAGRTAGPFTADERGEVELRLPARPGENTATIRAKDATGARRGRTMKLPTPPQNKVVTLRMLPSGGEGDTPPVGFWLHARGKSSLERLLLQAEPGGLLQPEELDGGLLAVRIPETVSLGGWDEVTVQVRLRKDPVSRADLTLVVPEARRGPGLLLLAPEAGPPEGLVQALREAGVRPRVFKTTQPFAEKAGRLLAEGKEKAAAWTEGEPPRAVLVMSRPGDVGDMVEERFESEEREPGKRWAALAAKLRAALKRPPKVTLPDPGSERGIGPGTPEVPPLPEPTTAVCETQGLAWWPHRAFALTFALAPKVALGGGELGANFTVGTELRGHLKLLRRPAWLSDLRVLAGASLSVDAAERIVAGDLGIWLRGRYALLDLAALLPLDLSFERLLLVGPRVALRVGQLKAKAVVVDGYLAPEAQLAADLSAGLEARFRLRRVELGTGLAAEIPLLPLTVLPAGTRSLLHEQVRLRADLRVSFLF